MAGEVQNLNIIGNHLVFFANGLFALAANTVVRAEEIQDEESKKVVADLAITFNIVGAWIQLFGDYILFKAAQLDFNDKVESNELFDEQGGRLQLTVTEAQVVLDVLAVQLAERAAEVVR
jgi:hypothetical protein